RLSNPLGPLEIGTAIAWVVVAREELKYVVCHVAIFIVNVINHRATNTTERRIFLHPTTSFFQRVILSPPLSKMPLSQENRIQMAIAAYKNQKVKSILKAAEIFGVPEATLRA
ncbi:hypothetical protein T310_8913, partial [Rasamsonia emersonii CBS 393.64]